MVKAKKPQTGTIDTSATGPVVYQLVPFDEFYNKVRQLFPKKLKNLPFMVALYSWSKSYGLAYYSVPGVLNSPPNKATSTEHLKRYYRLIKCPDDFKNLRQAYTSLDEDTKDRVRALHKETTDKLMEYRDSLTPLLTRKKITLTLPGVTYPFQRRNPRYE